MKICLFFLLLLSPFRFTVFAQQLNSSKYAIIPYDNTNIYVAQKFHAGFGKTELTDKEIEVIDTMLVKSVREYNVKQFEVYKTDHKKDTSTMLEWYLIDLKKYRFQFVPAMTTQGQKVIWVNGFCEYFDSQAGNWRQKIVLVYDGGICFFNLMVDVTKNIYYNFSVNSNG